MYSIMPVSSKVRSAARRAATRRKRKSKFSKSKKTAMNANKSARRKDWMDVNLTKNLKRLRNMMRRRRSTKKGGRRRRRSSRKGGRRRRRR